jgi:hypothetical protein
MNPHDPTSLDPEERALAQRLARLGPHGEPSPVLDSRVLAAAHAAVDGRRQAIRHASRRWPLGLGVAASLALALGLAWQLRPLPGVAPAYRSEADSALRTAPVAASTASDGTEPVPPPSPAETAAADGVQRETATADALRPATRSASAEKIAVPTPQPAPAPAAPQEAQIVFDAPASTQAMQAAAPPTPAKAVASSATRVADTSAATALPAPASAPQAFGTTRAAADAGSTPSPSAERAMAPAAATMRSGPARQKSAAPAVAPPAPPAPPVVATTADEDMPIDDVPPATVASPQVRDAWLARIRELAADGNIEDARASLHEFQHRYPDYPLPQDLRALLP